MNHTRHLVDVDAAGCDVSADEHLGFPGLEKRKCSVSLSLRAVTMDRYCAHANLGELARESLGAVLGPTKHDGRAVRECDSSSEVGPSGAIHAPEVVRPSAHRVGWRVEHVTTRIVLVLLDQAVNVALQRGRKQQRLVL